MYFDDVHWKFYLWIQCILMMLATTPSSNSPRSIPGLLISHRTSCTVFYNPLCPYTHGCDIIIWSWSTFQRPHNPFLVNSLSAKVGVFEFWPHIGMLTGLCRQLQLLWSAWVQLFLLFEILFFFHYITFVDFQAPWLKWTSWMNILNS